MTILKALMRVRLASFKKMYLGASSKKGGKDKGKNRTLLFALLLVYLGAAFTIMFFGMFSAVSMPFYSGGLGWVYFALYVLLDFALMFIGTVFTAKAQLYEATDNDLLLSMPIPPRCILLSRLFVLWILNSFFNVLVSGAAAAAWLIYCPASPGMVIAFLLTALFLPLFSVAVASLFGYLISLSTRRIRNKTAITMVFSLTFLAAYFILMNKAPELITQMAYMGDVISDKFRSVAVLYWAGTGIADGNVPNLCLFLAVLIVPFAAAFVILDRTFIKNVTSSRGAAKKEYREKAYKKTGTLSALYKKEARRFTNSAIYMMNTGLGAIFEIAAGVVLLIKMPMLHEFISMSGFPAEYLVPAAAGVLCLMSSMIDISSASVSIEGKSLWIVRAAPVRPETVLRAKLLFHYSFAGVSSLIASVLAAVALKTDAAGTLLLIALPQLFSLFADQIGLCANLRYPNLEWENESQAVKTGVAVLIGMFVPMGAAAAGAAIVFGLSKLMSMTPALLIIAVLFAAADALLYRYLMTKGVKQFSEL